MSTWCFTGYSVEYHVHFLPTCVYACNLVFGTGSLNPNGIYEYCCGPNWGRIYQHELALDSNELYKNNSVLFFRMQHPCPACQPFVMGEGELP